MTVDCLRLAAILLLPALECQPSTTYSHPTLGYLSAYAQTPTDTTLAYRIEHGQIDPDTQYDALIAVYDCWRVGQTATLHTIYGSFTALVFDCANDADGGQAWMIAGGYVAEVDWYTWQEWPGLIGSWAEVEYHD